MEEAMKKKIFFTLALMLAFTISFAAISVSAAIQSYYDELYNAIVEAECYDESKYTPESYENLRSELDKAYDIIDRNNVSSYVVERVIASLNDAISNLEPITPEISVDTSALILMINTASDLRRENYDVTDEEWENFQSEISFAENMLNDYGLTQDLADLTANNLSVLISQIESRRIFEDFDDFEKEETLPNDIPDNKESATIIISTETLPKPTEKVTRVYPKSTTPFAQGGFVEIGCGASAAISALVVVGIIGSALVIKKKED